MRAFVLACLAAGVIAVGAVAFSIVWCRSGFRSILPNAARELIQIAHRHRIEPLGGLPVHVRAGKQPRAVVVHDAERAETPLLQRFLIYLNTFGNSPA
jgi:hypothetical protein